MTILITADTVGGVWTYALDLMRSLPRARWILATMGEALREDQREELREVQRLTDVILCESRFALEWMPEPWRDVDEAGRWLLDLEAEHAPGIVHLNGYAHAALPFEAPVLVVAHSCVLSWWQAVKGEDAPPSWNCYRERVRAGLLEADLVAAPTQAMLGEVEALYGPLPQPESRLQVLANGRTLPDATRPFEKEPFVFAAGRLWDEAKNIALLEQAAPHLRWPVRVAGHGEASSDSSIQFLGRIESWQVLEQMRRAAIYALPARYEPFGLSILEAALCGCALVVGDIPSLREVWGEAALFVAPDDQRALADAINTLARDDARRAEMARRAGERARCFSTERFGQRYERAYRDLLEARLVGAGAPGAELGAGLSAGAVGIER